MIINAINGVLSDTYILQIITQQELQNLTKILQKDSILKIKNVQSKPETRDIHEIEKRNSISISVFGCENKVKY